MQSSEPDGQLDHDSDMSIDNPLFIPDFARAWELLPQVATAVRRPSSPPDPQLYHTEIDPQAIFELDEAQTDGSIQTILVVPSICKRCRSIRQACSRAKPACRRCMKSGQPCKPVHEAYERLPGPKVSKGSNARAKSTDATVTDESASTPEPTLTRIRIPRAASMRAASLLQEPLAIDPEPSVAVGSKRPLSPEQAPFPLRKKMHTNTASRKGKGKERCHTEELPNTTSGSGALTWTFVDPSCEQDVSRLDTIPSFTSTPRVWTSSLSGLLNVFPELDNAPTGLSWVQSETPLLLLEDTSVDDHWMSSTALCINMSWNFTCYDSDLETTIEPVTTPQHTFDPVEVHHKDGQLGDVSENNDLAYEVPMTTTCASNSPSTSTLHDITGPGGGQSVPAKDIASSSTSDAQDPASSHAMSDHSYPAESITFHVDPQPNIPLVKPAEMETLIDSHLRHIPLLIWMSRDCNLAPRTSSAEYAYLSMGFFFISDLRHTVINYAVCPTSGVIEGQVCWNIKLEWAPGGEEALFGDDVGTSSDEQLNCETRKNLSHPWWINLTEASSPEGSTLATPYRPRDLRMQFSTYLPLDLLADFHPSEFFPRGWFCSACGMINIQKYFRHQICQSSLCRSTSGERVPQGKVDPLSSLRDPYQCQMLLHPTDDIPSVLNYREKTTWTDGMQSSTYAIKDEVTVCHVFTGNQESLQTDANILLETIQSEALLSREDHSSPYFIHVTRLLHTADGSGTTVPVGTPPCIRTAYYTLRDFVERYGEMEKPAFGEIHIRAWTTPGSKRGLTFHAKSSPVVILCLGAEVVLNFTPKGGYDLVVESTAAVFKEDDHEHEDRPGSPLMEHYAGPSQLLERDGDAEPCLTISAEAMEVSVIAEATEQPASVANVAPHQSPDTGEDSITCPDSTAQPHTGADVVVVPDDAELNLKPKRNRLNKRKEKKTPIPEISMTLVHGDGAILVGDDFECQIVRTGTTILVIGFS